MMEEVPGRDLENRVALFLHVSDASWACRECIGRTLDLPLREVKIGLLRLARFHGRDYIETDCAVCEGCGAKTAVVRLGRRSHLRLIA